MAENDSTKMNQDNSLEMAAIISNAIRSGMSSATEELKRIYKEIASMSGDYSKNSAEQRRSGRRGSDFDFNDVKVAGKNLDKTLFELQKQFKVLQNETKKLSADWKSSSAGTGVGSRYLEISQKSNITKQYQDALESIKNSMESQKSLIESQVNSGGNQRVNEFKNAIIESARTEADQRKKSAEDQKKLLEEQKQTLIAQIQAVKSMSASDEDKKKQTDELEKQIRETSRNITQTSKEIQRIQDEEIERIANSEQEALKKVLSEVDEKYNKKIEKEAEKYKQNIEQLEEQIESLDRTLSISEDLANKAESASSALSSASSSYADYLRRNVEQKPYEKMKDMISDAQQYFESALKSLNESIDEISDILERDDLSDEDREYYEKQRKLLNQQSKNIQAEQKFWKDAKPSTILFKDAAQTMKTAGLNIVKNLGSSALKYVEDKYLNVYKEGFNNVYNSIESTRNSVSARLRLDQGGFSELQAEIQDEIEAQGWEGTVTQSDVNEALVALSSAGITDTEMLKSLALQQSKMSALGSSFNLNNEETLQRIQEMYRNEIAGGATQDEAMSAITNMMDDLLAYEVNIRETMGDAGLINNQMNQVFNQLSNLGLASGATTDEIEKAVESGMYAANASYYAGLDPTVYTSMLQELMDNSTEQNSIINKILEVGSITGESLTRDELERYIREEPSKIYEIIQQTTNSIIANPNVDEKYLREYLDAFGISMSTVDASKLRKSATATTSITDKEITQAEKDQAKAQNQMALQDARYQSTTLTTQKKAENAMTEIATELEKQYKGNEIFEAGFQAVEGLLGGIKDVASSILTSMWTNNISHNINGENISDFLTGGISGTDTEVGANWAKAGKVAGTAVGVGLAGHSIYTNIKNKDENEDALSVVGDIATDSEFTAGLGTAIGSAIGGPVAGAIVGALWGGASKVGNLTADTVSSGWLLNDKDYQAYLEENKIQEEAAEKMKEAAESLYEATQSYSNTITEQEAYINDQKEAFKVYDENDKKRFINSLKLTEEQKEELEKDSDINKQFEKAVAMWAEEQERQMELTRFKSENVAATSEAISSSLGVQNTGKLTKEELKGWTKEAKQEKANELIEAGKLTKNYTEESFIQAFNEYQEELYDVKSLKQSGGYDLLDTVTEFQELGNYDSLTKALMNFYSDQLEQGVYTTQDIIDLASNLETLQSDKDAYLEANEIFQTRWKQISNSHKGENVNSLAKAYNSAYRPKNSVINAIAGAKIDDSGILYEFLTDASGLPYLRYTDDNGNITYNPKYYQGKFKTGLTEVPTDNYMAILHEGERVLTAEEAEAYNEMSSYAVSNFADSINNYGNSSNVFNTTSYGLGNFEDSINGQTESLSAILNQILTAIQNLNISIRTGSSMSSAAQSLIRGNTNLTQLNTM